MGEGKKITLEDRPKDKGSDITTVYVNYYINSVSNIEGTQFTCDLYVDYSWTDIRYRGVSEDDVDWENTWKPEIDIPSAASVDTKFDNYILDSDTGVVTHQTNYCGEFHSLLKLQRFPFDTQELNLKFESSAHPEEELRIVKSPAAGRNYDTEMEQPEWQFIGVRDSTQTNFLEFDGSKYSQFVITMVVSRNSGFYLTKVVSILMIVAGLNLSVHFMDASDLGDRQGVSLTLLLTAVAFQFSVNDTLPKVAYTTVFDKYFFASYVMLAFNSIMNVVIFRMAKIWDEKRVEALDWNCFLAETVFFILLQIYFMSFFVLKWRNCNCMSLQRLDKLQRLDSKPTITRQRSSSSHKKHN